MHILNLKCLVTVSEVSVKCIRNYVSYVVVLQTKEASNDHTIWILTRVTGQFSLGVVIYSWLGLDSRFQRLSIVDPAASILVGRIIPVIIKAQTFWHATAKVLTSSYSLNVMVWVSSLNIVLSLGGEWDGTPWAIWWDKVCLKRTFMSLNEILHR